MDLVYDWGRVYMSHERLLSLPGSHDTCVVGYVCVGFAHTDYMERSLFMGLMWDGGESCVLVGSVVVRFFARSLILGALS